MKRRNNPRDGLRRQAERLDALVQMVTRLQREQARTDGALKDAELAIQRLRAANQWNVEWTAAFRPDAYDAYYAHAQRVWEAAVQQVKDADISASRNDRCEASSAPADWAGIAARIQARKRFIENKAQHERLSRAAARQRRQRMRVGFGLMAVALVLIALVLYLYPH